MALAFVPAREAYCEHRRSRERRRRVCSLARREPPMAEARTGADDARSNRAHRHVEPAASCPGERRASRDALEIAAEAATDRNRGGDQASRAQHSDRVRET